MDRVQATHLSSHTANVRATLLSNKALPEDTAMFVLIVASFVMKASTCMA